MTIKTLSSSLTDFLTSFYNVNLPACDRWGYIHATIEKKLAEYGYTGDIGTIELQMRAIYADNPCPPASVPANIVCTLWNIGTLSALGDVFVVPMTARWKNTGGSPGTFTPSFTVNGVKAFDFGALTTLSPGEEEEWTGALQITVASATLCPLPAGPGIACVDVTVSLSLTDFLTSFYNVNLPACDRWGYIHATIEKKLAEYGYTGDIGTIELQMRAIYADNPCPPASVPANIVCTLWNIGTLSALGDVFVVPMTARWKNTGGSPGTFTPSFTVNGVKAYDFGALTTLSPGEEKEWTGALQITVASATLCPLPAGPGIACVNVAVLPANITATAGTAISPVTGEIDINMTWTNTGGQAGSFIPKVSIDGGAPIDLGAGTITLAPGATYNVVKALTGAGITSGTHVVCPVPN